mmetsp:Transcript_8878/g.21314  ORF Transcript_8878/g.21314 Transcript_8878/m.21314 type:complete len:112 (+) Transcript_8878:511-846(+)
MGYAAAACPQTNFGASSGPYGSAAPATYLCPPSLQGQCAAAYGNTYAGFTQQQQQQQQQQQVQQQLQQYEQQLAQQQAHRRSYLDPPQQQQQPYEQPYEQQQPQPQQLHRW